MDARNAEGEAFQAFHAAEEAFARMRYSVVGPLVYLNRFQCRAEMRHVFTAVIASVSQGNDDMKRGT